MKYKKILIAILCLLCCACKTNKNKIIEEYEKYNNKYKKIELTDNNILKQSTKEEISKIINNKTGVILIGNPKDNLSRTAIEILLSSANNTDLKTIYYIDTLKGISGIEEIENKNIPLVLFVLKGELISYHTGTIDNKSDLTEDETIELYNIYTEGIHKVLQDACDEEC